MALFMKLLCVGLLGMLAFAPHAEAAVRCPDVASPFSPCATFLFSGGTVSPACCSMIWNLDQIVTGTSVPQTICDCIDSTSREAFNACGFASALNNDCSKIEPRD